MQFSTEARENLRGGTARCSCHGESGALDHEPQVSRIRETIREVAARLEQHIEETKGQIRRIDEILTGLDASSSTMKDAALFSFHGHDGRGWPHRGAG